MFFRWILLLVLIWVCWIQQLKAPILRFVFPRWRTTDGKAAGNACGAGVAKSNVDNWKLSYTSWNNSQNRSLVSGPQDRIMFIVGNLRVTPCHPLKERLTKGLWTTNDPWIGGLISLGKLTNCKLPGHHQSRPTPWWPWRYCCEISRDFFEGETLSCGVRKWLGGGFKYFLFSTLFGEDSHFDEYFSDGLKPPTRWWFWRFFAPKSLVVKTCYLEGQNVLGGGQRVLRKNPQSLFIKYVVSKFLDNIVLLQNLQRKWRVPLTHWGMNGVRHQSKWSLFVAT